MQRLQLRRTIIKSKENINLIGFIEDIQSTSKVDRSSLEHDNFIDLNISNKLEAIEKKIKVETNIITRYNFKANLKGMEEISQTQIIMTNKVK